MSLPFKTSLRSKLLQIAPTYNMTDIVFPSFNRTFGYKGTVSAADAVYSLEALMDYGAEWVTGDGGVGEDVVGLAGVGVGLRTGVAAVGLRVGGFVFVDDEEEDGEVRRRRWVKNFYVAYDALDK